MSLPSIYTNNPNADTLEHTISRQETDRVCKAICNHNCQSATAYCAEGLALQCFHLVTDTKELERIHCLERRGVCIILVLCAAEGGKI